MAPDRSPVVAFTQAQEWASWLEAHHAASPGIWMKIPKKGSAHRGISYDEALTVALCFGWIDGQKGRLDDDFWLQRFTPRARGSRWSQINTERATALIEAGQMRPAGLSEVEKAKADGRWEQAYESQSRVKVPEDFARALAADESARAFFATLDSANRYAVLYRIGTARRPQTRARRIEEFVRMLSEHRKIHP